VSATSQNGATSWRPLSLSLIVLGALTRVLPHPPNLTAVGAVSLFSGARLTGWRAYVVPLAILALSEPIMSVMYGFPPFTWVSLFVYASFAVNVWIGTRLRGTESPWRIGAASLVASTQFYLVTNFGVWVWGQGYNCPQTLAGLMHCYLTGLPYYGRMLLGDLLYAGVLFGVHAWLTRRAFPAERVVAATAQ
jgi:Family of unknown function (DUF6580)